MRGVRAQLSELSVTLPVLDSNIDRADTLSDWLTPGHCSTTRHRVGCDDHHPVPRRALSARLSDVAHVDAHRIGEERSLELHRIIAKRLGDEPQLVADAVARLARWREAQVLSGYYAEAWLALLQGPRDKLRAAMTDDGPRGRELRQTTPFAGVVDPRTRWRVWREVREALEAQ